MVVLKKVDVAILGCTGTVGQRLVSMLYNHPWFDIAVLAASERSAGKKYGEVAGEKWHLPTEIPEEVASMEVVDVTVRDAEATLVFSALPADVARKVEPEFAEAGCVVSSNASAFRMEEDVPLIIPEVNPDHLKLVDVQRERRGWQGCIVTDPNCTTIGLVIALKPIYDHYGLERVYVATMQAVSGAGLPGVPSLMIIDNIIPYISGEEEKVIRESRKILGKLDGGRVVPADFKVEASCNRVPVLDGHTESVFLVTESEIDVEEVKEVFRKFRGEPQKLKLPSAPEQPIIVRDEIDRPQPRLDRMAGSVPGMSVNVGRIRRGSEPNSLAFTVLSHNTIRGAAGAAILNAELMMAYNMVRGG
ncbi:MAG: aspartate-semialdehyde dehydrogenase [Candidatus Jordarchaeales archaeon]